MKILKHLSVFALVLVMATGCKKDVLEVGNNNQPDFDRVYASGEGLENLTSSLFNNFYGGVHSYSGVELMLGTAADHFSCSWGNQAMRDMSWEPRDFAWNNSPSYSYQATTNFFFDRMYGVIVTASNVLTAMENGVDIGANGADNERAKAFLQFSKGIAFGQLALVFDKAFVVDENIIIENESLDEASSFEDVKNAAVGYLDEAIALSNGSFTIPKSWLGTASDMSSAEFKKLCNTMAARILSYTPRNSTQLAAVDWNKVKTYADNGITSDFTVINDGYVKWYAEAGDYATFPGWGVTDMYVVNLLDPQLPQHWDDSPSFPYPPASTNPDADKRITTDFEFLGSNWFQAARGYYHYSNYRHARYDAMYAIGEGPKPEVMLSENDMLRAEARVYLDDLAGAAAIINAGTRNTRGELPDVAAVKEDLIQAIHHERHVEMYTTGAGIQFFEMRKLNLLQKGTPLHLPLPAKKLELFSLPLPFYTFGGTANADGINVSNGGWR